MGVLTLNYTSIIDQGGFNWEIYTRGFVRVGFVDLEQHEVENRATLDTWQYHSRKVEEGMNLAYITPKYSPI